MNAALAQSYKAREVIVVDDATGETPGGVTFVESENLIQKDRMHRASASAMVVNRTTFQQAGGWTEGLFHLDDLDMMMKLIESIRKLRNVFMDRQAMTVTFRMQWAHRSRR